MTSPAARLALLPLLALAACGVQVNTQSVYSAPISQADTQRTALAERTSREISPADIERAKSLQDPAALAELVNAYRVKNGLPPVPLSPLLNKVAEAHVADMASLPEGGLSVLETTDPETGQECSPHSWSAKGSWTPVCYTADGRHALAMYSKPREITGGAYSAIGFEIASFDTIAITPAIAIETWQKSPGHRTVILEQGAWDGSNWQAMGVGIGGHFAFVWFGKEPDPGAGK